MDGLTPSARAVLEKEGVYKHEAAGVIVCKKCACTIVADNKTYVRKHLRIGHELRNGNLESAVSAVLALHATLDESARQIGYRKESPSSEAVPAIDGLTVWNCKQCPVPHCRQYVKGAYGLKKHMSRQHPGEKRETGGQVYTCQTLEQKKGLQHFFRVIPGSCPDGNRLAERTEQQTVRCADRLSSDRAKKLAQFTFNEREVAEANDSVVPDWSRSVFVSLAKCEEYLSTCGISLSQASSLTSPVSITTDAEMQKCIRGLGSVFVNMFLRAESIANKHNRFRSFRLDIATPGVFKKDRPFRFFSHDDRGMESLRRYSEWAKVTVVVACRAVLRREDYSEIQVSEDLKRAVLEYKDYCTSRRERDDDDPELHRLIVQICMSVFFEKTNVGGKEELFANVLYVALCSHGTGLARDEPKWSNGTKTGSILCGVMYSVSCCVALQIYEYSTEEDVPAVHRELKEALEPCQPNGLTLLVELRAICSKVREWEYVGVVFTPCDVEGHGVCGYTNGVHLSSREVGDFVKRLQNRIKKEIFDDLLRGKPLPGNNFRDEVENLRDKIECNDDAYCALGDTSNEQFLRNVAEWIAEQVEECEQFFFCEEWQRKALRVLMMLVTSLHITGGAPGRGKEVGSYFFRNTARTRRSIFFCPGELLVIPTHDKRRFGMRGNFRFLSRHSDAETSFLFKTYLTVVRPIVEMYLTEKADTSAAKDRIRDLLLCDQVEPKRLSTEINRVLNEFEFPLKFQEYRHHSRGLVKLRCIQANDKESLSALIGCADDEEDDEETNDEAFEDLSSLQEIELRQAAHSVRTATSTYGQFFHRDNQVSLLPYLSTIEKHRLVSQRWHVELGIRDAERTIGFRVGKRARPTSLNASEVSEEVLQKVARKVADQTARRLLSEFNNGMEAFRPLPCEDGGLVSQGGEEATNGDVTMQENGTLQAENSTGASELCEWQTRQPTTTLGEVQEYIDECAASTRRPDSCKAFNNGFTALAGLSRAVGNREAVWKSTVQKEAMTAVARSDGDVLVVIGTGGGKTAVALGPIFFEGGYTLWVTPLRALLKETESKLKRLGIHVETLSTFTRDLKGGLGNVLLISPEDLGRELFHRIFMRLEKGRVLNRVVIDEAHLVVTEQGYRESMRQISVASRYGTSASVVMLSATVPESVLPLVAKGCGSTVTGLDIYRGDPVRGNLRLEVKAMDNASLVHLRDACVDRVLLLANSAKESCRAIVYCLTRNGVHNMYAKLRQAVQGTELGKKLSFGLYHGQLSEERSEQQLRFWRSEKAGEVKVMIATNAFGCGIDAPDVRLVVVVGACQNLVQFWQQAGRAGRDGLPADVVVLYHEKHMDGARVDAFQLPYNSQLGNFQHWAEDYLTCRRVEIERTLGGSVGTQTCVTRPENTQLCDVCKSRSVPEIAYRLGAERSFEETGMEVGDTPEIQPDNRLQAYRANKEPSREERLAGRREKLVNYTVKSGSVDWLRQFSKKIGTVCIHFVLDRVVDRRFLSLTYEEYRKYRRQAEQCPKDCDKRARCWRCRQPGQHRASECPNLESVYNVRGSNRCGECFLSTVGNCNVHKRDFGKQCVVAHSLSFCLICYSRPRTRRIILEDASPYKAAIRRGTLREEGEEGPRMFCSYLTKDRISDQAGIIDMALYLVKRLGLEKLGLH